MVSPKLDCCFHALALVCLKFDGLNLLISVKPLTTDGLFKMVSKSGWDYAAETTLPFWLSLMVQKYWNILSNFLELPVLPKMKQWYLDLRQIHWRPCKIRLNSKRNRVSKASVRLQLKMLHKMTTAKTHGNYSFLEGGSLNHFKLVAVIRNSALFQTPMMFQQVHCCVYWHPWK